MVERGGEREGNGNGISFGSVGKVGSVGLGSLVDAAEQAVLEALAP